MGKAQDFMNLKDKELQTDFLSKFDSIRKVQNPNKDYEISIMVDLIAEYLITFLADITSD